MVVVGYSLTYACYNFINEQFDGRDEHLRHYGKQSN